jgi:hypothetical protein
MDELVAFQATGDFEPLPLNVVLIVPTTMSFIDPPLFSMSPVTDIVQGNVPPCSTIDSPVPLMFKMPLAAVGANPVRWYPKVITSPCCPLVNDLVMMSS